VTTPSAVEVKTEPPPARVDSILSVDGIIVGASWPRAGNDNNDPGNGGLGDGLSGVAINR
jgi:hypothetical protein